VQKRGGIHLGFYVFSFSKFNLIALDKDGGYVTLWEQNKERSKKEEGKWNCSVWKWSTKKGW